MVDLLKVLWQFLLRDFYIFSKRTFRYFVNYSLIMPAVYSIGYGYFLSRIVFGETETMKSLIMFLGVIVFVIFPLGYSLNTEFLFDLQTNKFIEYQILQINPSLVILEKIVFSTIATFIISSLFYPISSLFVYEIFKIASVSIPKFILIFFLGSLMTSAFFIASMCCFKNVSQSNYFWKYLCYPMIQLGGFLTPWSVIFKTSKFLGYLVYINPIIYFTEGIRSSMTHLNDLLPYTYSALSLLLFCIIFVVAALITFKMKVDHI